MSEEKRKAASLGETQLVFSFRFLFNFLRWFSLLKILRRSSDLRFEGPNLSYFVLFSLFSNTVWLAFVRREAGANVFNCDWFSSSSILLGFGGLGFRVLILDGVVLPREVFIEICYVYIYS